MIKSFATSHQLINLINNGAFEYKGSKLHFWELSGVDATFTNKYQITTSGKTFASFSLMQDTPVSLYQSVGSGDRLVLDFLQVDSLGQYVLDRESVYGGYKTLEAKTLPHGTEYTLAFSVRVPEGSVTITPYLTDLLSETSTSSMTVTYEGGVAASSKTLSSVKVWRRLSFKFTASKSLYQVGLTLQRASSDKNATVEITDISLVTGMYDEAPYTGDTLSRVLPRDCVVLVMGDSCPEGFEAITNSAFVRSANDAGESTHHPDIQTTPDRSLTIDFEGYDSESYVLNTLSTYQTKDLYGAEVNPPVDVPDEKGVASHTHKLDSAGSLPVAISYRMCRKV